MKNQNLQQPVVGGRPVHRNVFVSKMMRTLIILTAMVMGGMNAWGQGGATFTMGGMWADKTINGTKLTFAGGGPDDVKEAEGYTILSSKEVDGVMTSASITLSGKRLKYIKITFNDNENTYKLKWGGAWNEADVANAATNTVEGKGSIVLTSNSGPEYFKIVNNVEGGTTSTPIKKVEVCYFDLTIGGDESSATKTITGVTSASNYTVPLNQVNVVGTYCGLDATNGNGYMLNEGANHYLSIKFAEATDLSKLDYLEIDGVNVNKSENGIFNSATFYCNGGNFDKYNNPAHIDNFDADQKSKLSAVNEIRFFNDVREGSFKINSIVLHFAHTLTWNTPASIPSGCDAWYTIGDDETHYTATTKSIPAGSKVVFHATDTGDDHKVINGWRKATGDPGWLGYGDTYTIENFTEDRTVYPEFQNCFRVFVNAENGATATVTGGSGKKYFWQATELSFSTTVPDGYTFDGWYNGASRLSEKNPYSYGTYKPGNGTDDLTLTAKFTPLLTKISRPDCGGVYMDQTKLNAGGGASVEVHDGKGTVTTGASGGYISLNFNEACSFTDLNKWTVNTDADNVAYVSFLKNGNVLQRDKEDGTKQAMTFYSGAKDRTLEDMYKAVLTSVDEIRIGFSNNSTTKINFVYLEIGHGPRPMPTLADPTTTDMRIFPDETLQLRITNDAGFWREFTDDTYETPTFEHIGHNAQGEAEWKPSYDISGLGVGDYYFGIKDGGNCAENNEYHESDLVKVHVKVIDPIASFNINGTKRYYDLYIPDGLTSSSTDKVGVVLSLHRKDYDYDEGRVDFNPVADENKNIEGKKFVVVYPRALVRDGHRNWQLDESSTDDTEFFKAIVKKINDDDNNLTVDMSRIYLAGYSDGGAMAFKVAHKDADFYSAIASVSGVPYDDSHLWHAGKKPVPFLFIQGANDGVFSEIGTTNVTTIAHNMMYRNGAAFTAGDGTITLNNTNKTVTKDCHEAETGGAAFYHYTVDQMWHQSDVDWNNDGTDDLAPTAWAFFNKNDKVNNLDETLKFRVNDPTNFWANASNYGFVKGANGTKDVLSYGGDTKTNGNKNIYHSLQFNGGINGAPHFLKMNIETDDVKGVEVATDYFLVTLTKIGADAPVFAKRYQAGRGKKDLYINFTALPNLNEYKLTVTKSRTDLTVNVHGVEFYSGSCKDKGQEENPVYFTAINTIVSSLNPIYQPVYGTTFDGLAKEYLPIANIPLGEIEETHVATSTIRHYKVIEDDLKVNGSVLRTTLDGGKLPSQWGATTASTTVTGTGYKNLYVSGHKDAQGNSDEKADGTKKINNIAYILGSNNYTVDPVKGLNISQYGRAEMVEYLNGTNGDFPTKGMLAIKFEGTCDFTLLAENDIAYNDNGNSGRSTLKVYYTNDQLDGELKELKEWWFYGTRSEANGNDNINNGEQGHESGNGLNTLSANIRLPQLGKDGTCTVFITYEGRGQHAGPFTHESGDDNKIWIKGFVIKRPDLKVTIGRTDSKYAGQKRGEESNAELTRFGENKPYIWSFENVGFNNTRRRTVNSVLQDDTQEKKVNENDWRTYVCGGTDDSMDHLLVYSDISSDNNNDKAQFDGRIAGQEHIEFRVPSKYTMKDDPTAVNNGRLEFNPITSNGLKVNVTGSGWFKIKASAPNGKVKMKVYSSTNYGITYTNLLREFIVDNSKHPESATGNEEHKWGEYTVYLKGHVERTWNDTNKKLAGFWDGDKIKYSEDEGDNAEEKVRMSLYVVFDKISGESYKEDRNQSGADASPQLNIHELSWLNEEPADYVFQREEDPKLLTTWQEIKRNGETILYWKAGNDDDKEYTMLKENGNDTYNRLSQTTTNISGSKGVNSKSPGGYASTSVPSDAGTYDAYWDIAAPASTNAHTEKAYGGTPQYNSNTEYINNGANNTEFDTPVSGSFIRICAMKNTYVAAHVIPGDANGYVYVLDETGAPIGFDGSTDDGKRRGYIATMLNVTDNSGDKKSDDATIRIDFCANAGKEYFICAKDASISLARLEVQDWRYKPAKSSTTLALVDGQNNSSAISTAYSSNEFYRDATLARKLTKGYWISLVLPFSMNEKKFKEVFGENARCIHFSGMDFDNKIVKLTHHYYNMIVAGRPVFVRPDIDILKTNPLEINDITLQTNIVRPTVIKTEKGNFTFTGSYDMQPIEQNDLFINNNQMTYLNITSSSYPGMRSFIQNGPHYNFETNTTPGQVGAKVMFLEFYDATEDIPTEVMEIIGSEFGKNVIVVTKSTKVYDLNGRVVAEGANISNLPAGIYIVNGKKYIVK